MYKPGQYLGKALSGEDINTREALGALGEGLVGIVAAFSGASLLSPSVANAQSKAHAAVPKRLTIDEYYQQARPADHIMPGAREQDFGYADITTHGTHFPGKEWTDYYLHDLEGKRDAMQNIFKAIDGELLPNGVIFDFEKFHDYWVNNEERYDIVRFSGNYMKWRLPGERKIVIIPMDRNTMNSVLKLW